MNNTYILATFRLVSLCNIKNKNININTMIKTHANILFAIKRPYEPKIRVIINRSNGS